MFDQAEKFRDPDEDPGRRESSKVPRCDFSGMESTYEEIMRWIDKPRAAAFICADCMIDLGIWRGNFWRSIRGGTWQFRLCTDCRVKRILGERPEEFAKRLSEKDVQSEAT